jgi:deoxyribodipyrimidine photo-lyase
MTISPDQALFEPSRAAALERLTAFVPAAGRDYAKTRNTDDGPGSHHNVSLLSAYIRHRMITEKEVLSAVLQRHTVAGAEKFVQEVLWRFYFKGYLETRPEIWDRYKHSRDIQIAFLEANAGYASTYESAISGKTGIDCFDAWVQELVETGYLHNHARMWFASIWCFTLKLPWELGADFTYRHFIDGDPASNTLSWRWVAGLHTKGKTYLARTSNISEYTNGRFDPKGLAQDCIALSEPPLSPATTLQKTHVMAPFGSALLLITEDDLHSESLDCRSAEIRAVMAPQAGCERSPLGTSNNVKAFTSGALKDGLARANRHFGAPSHTMSALNADEIMQLATTYDVGRILVPYTATGPVKEKLAEMEPFLARQGIELMTIGRLEDQVIWPHATKGFFALKERIPEFMPALCSSQQDDVLARLPISSKEHP